MLYWYADGCCQRGLSVRGLAVRCCDVVVVVVHEGHMCLEVFFLLEHKHTEHKRPPQTLAVGCLISHLVHSPLQLRSPLQLLPLCWLLISKYPITCATQQHYCMYRKTRSPAQSPRIHGPHKQISRCKTIALVITALIACSIGIKAITTWRTARALKHAPSPAPYVDVIIDTYLARVVDTVTTTVAQPHGWRHLQAGFRAAVLEDAKACIADEHDPAWRAVLDAAAADQASLDSMEQGAESGVERDAAGSGMWDELRSMVLFESEQVCTARSLSPWTTRSKPQYLLAGNMRDAQEVAPHVIRQLVIAVAVMQHHADVSVSIYESNSQDATGMVVWNCYGFVCRVFWHAEICIPCDPLCVPCNPLCVPCNPLCVPCNTLHPLQHCMSTMAQI